MPSERLLVWLKEDTEVQHVAACLPLYSFKDCNAAVAYILRVEERVEVFRVLE